MTVEVIDNDAEMALTPVTQARQMLAEATTLPQLKDLRDFAEGAKAWAKARKLGIDAENEAAEVVLRAERRIGQIMLDMRERGELAGPGQHQLRGSDTSDYLRQHKTGAPLTIPSLLDVDPKDWAVRQAHFWQNLAQLPEDIFERMLYSARVGGERLAKHNFYRAARPAKGSVENPSVPTREDPDFDTFRRGTYALLGWEIDETGKGHATRNGLMQLPNDELSQAARLIQALAAAYGEARSARG